MSIITVPSGTTDPSKFVYAIQQIAERINRGPAAFYAHKNSSNQSGLTHNAYTKITFGTARSNIGNYFDTTNSRWTPPAGPVQLNASIFVTSGAATSSGTFTVKITKNAGPADVGAGVGTAIVGLAGFAIAHVACVDVASGTDYYEANFFYTSALAANDGVVDGNPVHTHFSGMCGGLFL